MIKHKLALSIMVLSAFGAVSCEEENTSYLAALAMPGEMYPVSRCTVGGMIVKMDEAACLEAGGSLSHSLYVVNMGTATLSYAPFYTKDAEFKPIDISTSVPGVTSIPVGENPQSLAGDKLGDYDDTIIFFDEIQCYPQFFTLLKFLREDSRFHFIASGNALGVALHRTTSIPVGSVVIKKMFPLDFEEFLWATGYGKEAIDDVYLYYQTRRKQRLR